MLNNLKVSTYLSTQMFKKINWINYTIGLARMVVRRFSWFTSLSPGQFFNLLKAIIAFTCRARWINYYPVALKIDINANCNLKCTTCVHAEPVTEALKSQNFSQPLIIDEYYKNVIDECAGKSAVVSLYYLGDPIVSPQLTAYAKYASNKGYQVHISTNFSLRFSDEKIHQLANCGISHFTVCLDGFTQEEYSKTRIGGNIEIVKDNLARLCKSIRASSKSKTIVEVQSLVFNHNKYQQDTIEEFCNSIGVHKLSFEKGSLINYTDFDAVNLTLNGIKEKSFLPLCWWPFISLVVVKDGRIIPCCSHRLGEVYTPYTPNHMGHLENQTVNEIWNSRSYKRMRQMLLNPQKYSKDLESHDYFCHKCSHTCHTDFHAISDPINNSSHDKVFSRRIRAILESITFKPPKNEYY